MSSTGQRLMIIQPYVPAYRVPLFAQLRELLAERGIEMSLAAARAGGLDQYRGEDTTDEVADFILPERRRSVLGRDVIKRDVARALRAFQPQWIIVEQAIKNVESWPLILRQKSRNQAHVAMWGQGRSFSRPQSGAEAAVKQWLTRRADWFFAYTETGRDHVVAHGFPESRTTVLYNSTDTTALRHDIENLDPQEVSRYRQLHSLTSGRTALFIGGVDDRKGIPFLLEAVEGLSLAIPGFVLLVAGTGRSSSLVELARQQGLPVVPLGRVEGKAKALALAAADLLLIPEWVGLVAVDAIAAGKPVVSIKDASHSPEVEYLHTAGSGLFTDHDLQAFVEGAQEVLLRPEAWTTHALQAQADSTLSIEHMARRFADGVVQWVGSSV